MLGVSPEEDFLNRELLHQPQQFNYRFSDAADRHLRQVLFRSLARNRDDYFRYFFPNGTPPSRNQKWSLRSAQGAVDGAEYTAAAKGTACGHIFKSGESTYHCKTCAADDTCVLCARCFEASDHEGHTVFISVSPGNSGCCDCGDSEAWRKEVHCSIHTDEASTNSHKSSKDKSTADAPGSQLPQDLVESIQLTIARATDYLCDVFSCAPEQLRLAKTEQSILTDERLSRLSGAYGEEPPEDGQEYVLILWNDEKHTIEDVQNQVARACETSKTFGREKACEVNDIGRSCVYYSRDIPRLIEMAQVIEQLKVTVTIRSARDTFREQMCATIIDWISDIAGCAVGPDPHLLRHVVCEEILKPWRKGSQASNQDIGLAGIDDHETEDNQKLRRRYQQMINPRVNVIRVMVNTEENDENEDENEDVEIDEYGDVIASDDMIVQEDDDMDMGIDPLSHTAADMDIDVMDDSEDVTEVLEATIAGYPAPPPPERVRRIFTPTESEDGEEQPRPAARSGYEAVPSTPNPKASPKRPLRPNKYWLEKPEHYRTSSGEFGKNQRQRVRLAFLILYDLRLWKTLRISLRHLYITTVVTVPRFKRVLGLQFAGLYTALAQLYLIADREPDHSIINLSVQMLTTPTIAREVVERGNFLTNLMAILFTFLTTRQVGYPEDIDPKATLAFDAGAVTNRRMFHFFLDLRWLFQSEYIHERLRTEQRYLLQFLDLVKLLQGVCPNTRATGEHLEYEPDAWISASMIVKEINKLCKLVAASFEPESQGGDAQRDLLRAARTVAHMTMIHSFGLESKRFRHSEAKGPLAWHVIGPFESSGKRYSVPKFDVQREAMSFHHPMHYLLSWLLENAKTSTREEMRALLNFSIADLKDPWAVTRTPQVSTTFLTADELLCSIFEHPLRVYVWLSQMKAGMWVRNGVTLRHQAHSYRSVSNRDVGYQRDILMLQLGLVLCGADAEQPGERFLAQMIDRFEMTRWFQGDFSIVPGFEESQQLDVIEDFYHLLVVVLSERSNLAPSTDAKKQHDDMLRHDIAHALCFKPLSFSDLAGRVTEKVGESEDFNRVLETLTVYRAPEGLTDSGTFELKPEYIELVDPFYAHYSRNHREEAENLLKKHIAGKTGKKPDEVVYEPKLQPIDSGLFQNLSAFTRTPLFAQILRAALTYAAGLKSHSPKMHSTRVETFLHMVLHLIGIAASEDETNSLSNGQFARLAAWEDNGTPSIISILIGLFKMDEYASCHQAIKKLIRKIHLRQPTLLTPALGSLGEIFDRADTGSPASISSEDKDKKKQEALARQARIMAQMKQQQNSFLQNQGLSFDDEDFEDIGDYPEGEDADGMAEQRKTWHFPSGTCILCQEDADDQRLYGTFAYLGESNILRPTPMDDLGYVKEVIDTPQDLDRPADHIRPFGVSGSNRHTVQKVTHEGNVVDVERQDLSRGFPHMVNGITGPVSTSCGHIMHYKCFELYIAATQRRHSQQIARHHPERLDKKEFVCPLCKALGNTFLPIIWKAKECATDYELHAARPFADWLQAVDSDAKFTPDMSFLQSSQVAMPRWAQLQEAFTERSSEYVAQMFAPSLVSGMRQLSIDPLRESPQQRVPLRRNYSLSSLFQLRANRPDSQGSIDSDTLSPISAELPRMNDLATAYLRINETIEKNRLWFDPSLVERSANPVGSLSRALGMSVSAFEIAHRGFSNNPLATSLLSELSEQSLIHLRILSETIESFLAVNVLRPAGLNNVASETAKHRDVMVAQLFGVESELDMIRMQERVGRLLFQDDLFLFFVDWLSFMGSDVAEASSVLQLCYWAEIVKTVFVFRSLVRQHSDVFGDARSVGLSDAFRLAVSGMIMDDASDAYLGAGLDEGQLSLLRSIVNKYALTFLRKAILVMHVRYGLEFECPYNLNSEAPELDRLTELLHVSSIDELCKLYTTASAGGGKLREVTKRWLQQAHTTSEHEGYPPSIVVPHPAIFELVGLPKNYDTLTEAAIRRKCPTTGKEVTDPAVCLFCGDIFCSQALCCQKTDSQKKDIGGCYQHMQKCGGKVGVFINVRKCMVLFLHGPGSGSYAHAPYLDKHGEPDPTLRRHHQLFLNQRRYDKLLRDVWLQHSIPTVISRKLEADVNPGGWESL